MRRRLLVILGSLGLLAGGRLFADVVTLKDGRQITGSVESGNTQELHIKAGDQSQTIDVHQIQTIQFSGSSPAPVSATAEPAASQPNSLILKDGTRVSGRWWSIDATDMHFLVNNQLEHYPRQNVSAVTFGNATLPPVSARPTAPPTTPEPEQPPPGASQPVRPPTLARPADNSSPRPPTLTRPPGSAAPTRGLSQPEDIGAVYFWNGRDLTALERNQAAEHSSRSTQYYEMPGPKSRVRMNEAPSLVFILRLAKGIDPASYSLFPLVTVNGNRRTRSQPGRGAGLLTWPVDIAVNDDSSLITYTLTVRDLPAGEYSFSPSSSNDGYCFGVDPSEPGK